MENFATTKPNEVYCVRFKDNKIFKATENQEIWLMRFVKTNMEVKKGFHNKNEESAILKVDTERKQFLIEKGIEDAVKGNNIISANDLYPGSEVRIIVEESYQKFFDKDKLQVYPEKRKNGDPHPLANQPKTRDGKPYYRQTTLEIGSASRLESLQDVILPYVESKDSEKVRIKAKTVSTIK